MRGGLIGSAGVALFCLTGIAHAEPSDCKLVQLASFDVSEPAPGTVAIHVTIDGLDQLFAVSTRSVVSLVSRSTVEKFHLSTRVVQSSVALHSQQPTQLATIPTLVLGGLKGTDLKFFVAPDGVLPRGGVAGVIGLDKLSAYDVELDLAHKKINLFDPNHCKGQVVYWTSTAVTIPFEAPHVGEFWIPLTLDGKIMRAQFDTVQASSRMTFATAHRMFDLTRASNGMTLWEPPVTDDDVPQNDIYRYPFQAISSGGLVINNPAILIDDFGDQENACNGRFRSDLATAGTVQCFGGGNLQVGLTVLRSLRLFIAFSEHTLYLTGADAH
jgi:hypothetical protein